MTKPNSAEIVFVIDRSGSMSSIAEDMNGGFSTFIDKQRAEPGECRVTLAQFDDPEHYEVLYEARPISEVGRYRLEPRGSTALLDAIGRTIESTGRRLAALAEVERPGQVLFVIITDGEENRSVEYRGEAGRKAIFDKITHQREKYNWEFIFLGANQDSITTANRLGISVSNAVTFNADHTGTKNLMGGLSAGVSTYRRSGQARSAAIYSQKDYDALAPAPGPKQSS